MVFLWHGVEVVTKFTRTVMVEQLSWLFTEKQKWYRSEHALQLSNNQACPKNYLNKMLTLQQQGKIVEKIVRTKTGELALATFYVSMRDGEFDIQLLSVSPVSNSSSIENCKLKIENSLLCLLGQSRVSPAVTFYRHNYHSVPSPFFNTLEFFVSQPTRAPSAKLSAISF